MAIFSSREKQNKTKSVTLRLTERQKAFLDSMAEERKMSKTDLIMELLERELVEKKLL